VTSQPIEPPVSTGGPGPVSSGQRSSDSVAQPGAAGPGPATVLEKHYRVVTAKTADEAQAGNAPLLAVTGLVIWAITYYVFDNNIPSAVSVGLYVIVPAAISWIATHVTVKKVTL
jgi:hypothetical protein